MKILAFTDIHNRYAYLKKIKEKTKLADIVVFLGDLTDFGIINTNIIKELKKIQKTILMIHGNHDDEKLFEEISKESKNIIYLHKKMITIKDRLFIGFGGGGFSFKEPEFDKFISRNLNKIKKHRKIILMTHAPPYKTCVDYLIKEHLGNISYKKFILKMARSGKKILSLSGHFHENEKKICKTKNIIFLNPGPEGYVLNF